MKTSFSVKQIFEKQDHPIKLGIDFEKSEELALKFFSASTCAISQFIEMFLRGREIGGHAFNDCPRIALVSTLSDFFLYGTRVCVFCHGIGHTWKDTKGKNKNLDLICPTYVQISDWYKEN